MQKVAILLEDYYQVLEVWYPYLRLREDGIEPVLVGTGKKNTKARKAILQLRISLFRTRR